ncbi:NAD(P)/FAD-dependent oxidoreductase [Rhodococcus triatomae]|uniref:NAD(P)/FAD-dependent oxidoreductase n=1 Tax=Rhodococcus triatomae TaxID=300028 RepID=UPI000934244A|nr:NAD(P)/FAD-dependent oxidoreductase [Rhodococcus triatomae]
MTVTGSGPRPRVVIVGGGFGGLRVARQLRGVPADVVLLDRRPDHVFQPLLYQCATGLLSEGEISSPLRHLLRRQRNVDVVLGEATDVDLGRGVVVATRFDGSRFELGFDHLVVAAGMRQAYHGHDEYVRWAPGMKTLDDALEIRRRIVSAFEMAESLPTAEERRPWLTFVVAGAGPTGVELAGQIRELATRALEREFRTVDPAEARVLLVHGGDRVLPSFAPTLSRAARRALDGLGVETHLGVHVTAVDEHGVETTTKGDAVTARYDARTVLWTAGVEAVPFAQALASACGVEQVAGGRIAVTPDLRVPAHPRVRVIGDLMALDELPGVAEVAMQSGRYVGRSLREEIVTGLAPRRPFRYRDLGTAAYISRGNAIVQAGPVRVSGRLGWVSWGAVHIAFLAGYRNRIATLASWSATLASGSRRERAVVASPD